MTTTPEIEELKNTVEKAYGKTLETSTDFDVFATDLRHKTGEAVSSSTLKRIWGYVSDNHKPRITTLNALAHFAGHASYSDFRKRLEACMGNNSSFLNADEVLSCGLMNGDIIEIGWNPNRVVRLRCIGMNIYEVISSCNSKLVQGDRFTAVSFIKGHPLYLPCIERNGERTLPFVAGRNGGLTIINLLNKQ